MEYFFLWKKVKGRSGRSRQREVRGILGAGPRSSQSDSPRDNMMSSLKSGAGALVSLVLVATGVSAECTTSIDCAGVKLEMPHYCSVELFCEPCSGCLTAEDDMTPIDGECAALCGGGGGDDGCSDMSESINPPLQPEGAWDGASSMHDPTHMLRLQGGTIFVFASGGGVSANGGCVIDAHFMRPGSKTWELGGPMFGGCSLTADLPAWWARGHTENSDADAPEVLYSEVPKYPSPVTGKMHNLVMYYSLYMMTPDMDEANEDSSAQACIGRAVADWDEAQMADPASLRWIDDGKPVLCSNIELDGDGLPATKIYDSEAALCSAEPDACTYAIDPAVFEDFSGSRLFMSYGSGTILTVELDPTTGVLISLAQPGYSAVTAAHYGLSSIGAWFNEAPYVIKHEHKGTQYYYMFVNWYGCCAGVDSTYEIYVGRSTSPATGYVDHLGRSLADYSGGNIDNEGQEAAGGKLVLSRKSASGGVTNGRYIGPGHAGVFEYLDSSGARKTAFTFHWYDANECGASKLGVREMFWDSDGWPVISDDPWDPSEVTGLAQPPKAPSETASAFSFAMPTSAVVAVRRFPLFILPVLYAVL